MNDNVDIDVERKLTAWIREEGPEREPPGLLERVVSISAHSRPRPAALARLSGTHLRARTHQGMPRQRKERLMFSYRLIAAVAMVTVVAAIGWTVFIGPRVPGVGGPLVAPSAQPTVHTSPSESPVPVAATGPLAQGRYAAGRFLTGLRYELPPSWGVMEDQVSLYVLQRFPPDSASYPRGSTGVYCPDSGVDWGASCSNSYSQIVVQLDPVLGSNARDCEGLMASGAPTSVDGMIATLAVDPRFVTTDQNNVTIGGFSGKAIDIKVAPNWTEPCKWSDGKPAGLIFTVAQPPGPNFGITNEELEHVILLDLRNHTVSIGFRQGWRDTAESIVQTFEFGQ